MNTTLLRKKLSANQQIVFDLYRNCKKSSKKNHGLPSSAEDSYTLTDDEQLVYFALENCSQTAHDDQRGFYMTSRSIWNLCYKLCPGQWCDRSHCKKYSGHCAYNCSAGKRPSSCKDYKQYIERKTQRELVHKLTGKNAVPEK